MIKPNTVVFVAAEQQQWRPVLTSKLWVQLNDELYLFINLSLHFKIATMFLL